MRATRFLVRANCLIFGADMNFQDYLATFPPIDHLTGLDVQDADGKTVHHIPAVQGKLGSLKLYNALAERFGGKLGK